MANTKKNMQSKTGSDKCREVALTLSSFWLKFYWYLGKNNIQWFEVFKNWLHCFIFRWPYGYLNFKILIFIILVNIRFLTWRNRPIIKLFDRNYEVFRCKEFLLSEIFKPHLVDLRLKTIAITQKELVESEYILTIRPFQNKISHAFRCIILGV